MTKHTIRDPDYDTPRREHNDEFMHRIMNYGCPAGALIQGFILEGLRIYAEQCVAYGPEHFDSGLMNGEAWVACAKFYLNELREHQS
jgi:hypothetical protein